MAQLEEYLKPLIERLPAEARPYGMVIIGVAAALAILIVLLLVRATLGRFLRRRRKSRSIDLGPQEDLASIPPPAEPAGKRRLTVEGLPVRLRLVVVAPVGMGDSIEEKDVPNLLDQVLWGLGAVYRNDCPQLRVWPPQLSSHGFVVAFQRTMKKPEPDGELSRWVLVSGITPARPRPILLGLALWGEQPSFIGRLNLEPARWASVLRIQAVEETA